MIRYVQSPANRHRIFWEAFKCDERCLKIKLIKALRECVSLGLKEAKDAVEECQINSRDLLTDYDAARLSALFLTTYPEPESGEKENKDSPFILAMRNIEQNWQVLGFYSLRNAVEAVSSNF